MALPDEPVVLPFRAERLSFGISYTLQDQHRDRDGQLLDAAHADHRSALGGALCLVSGRGPAHSADELLVMSPFDFAPQCEVMLLCVSAPASPLKRSDLGCVLRLHFTVAARDKGAADDKQLLGVDLASFVASPARPGTGPLSNGHQTMAVCAVYSTPAGWTLSFDCSTFPADHWGAALPDLEALLPRRWPSLAASEAAAARAAAGGAAAVIVATRPGEDRSLAELLKSPEASTSATKAAGAAYTAAVDAPPAPPPLRVVLELGWVMYPPRRAAGSADGSAQEEAEEELEPMLEFLLAAYDAKGNELFSVSQESPEAQGLIVADPAEEEAPEQQERADTHASEAAMGEAGGEDGAIEDGDEVAAAARAQVAAAKKAEDEAGKRKAALRRPFYAETFPKKHKAQPGSPLGAHRCGLGGAEVLVTVVLSELPKAVRTLLLTISNFDGGGLKRVASLQARLLQPEAPQDMRAFRVLAHCRLDSAEDADEALTQVALLKLYRELPDGAFAVWAASGTADARSLAMLPAARDVLESVLEARRALVAEAAAAKARAEEQGLEEDDDETGGADEDEGAAAEAEAASGGVSACGARVQRLRLIRGAWRVRALCAVAGGEGPDEALVANALGYEGELATDGSRSDANAKALYPNGDTYYGGYLADVKAGMGLYVFASGAAYLGEYAAGHREGRGLMLMPDGSSFDGDWVADRFEGQGTYRYPDGSFYTGSWSAGRKHGQGTYWDSAGGCLAGVWERGALCGEGRYDQPHYHFEGRFVKSVPAGPCSFQLAVFRSADLPPAATGHLLAEHGPTLRCEGAYAMPAGAGAGGEDEGDAGGDGGDGQPALPAHPNYKGLTFRAGLSLPVIVPDLPFLQPQAATC